MIRHIMLFRLPDRDDAAVAEGIERVRAALAPLAGIVPGVVGLRVDADGTDIAKHWHAAAVSEHDSWEAFEAYKAHPAHVAAREVVLAVGIESAIVDYAV